MTKNTPLFPTGALVCTPGAEASLDALSMGLLLAAHVCGEWGELDAEDKQANDDAVKNGDRILSCYILTDPARRIWIITEADRSVTTILLPEEY